MKIAREYVNEWLHYRTYWTDENGNHLSAWTIQTEAKALSKLYGILPTDEDYFYLTIKGAGVRANRLVFYGSDPGLGLEDKALRVEIAYTTY